jgi:ABC-2 type transport system ATP-binding protein
VNAVLKGVAEIREVLLRLHSEEWIILIACHDKEELDYLSDRIFMMEEGRIVREDSVG